MGHWRSTTLVFKIAKTEPFYPSTKQWYTFAELEQTSIADWRIWPILRNIRANALISLRSAAIRPPGGEARLL